MVRVTGIVVPSRLQRLSFGDGGQLDVITATVGMTVTQGEPLAQLLTGEMELQLQLALAELESARAALDLAQAAPSHPELAAAQAAYQAAQAAYDKLASGPLPQEVAIAEAELHQAVRALQQAQAAYDAVRHLPDIGARRESLALEEASIAHQRAKAEYELALAGADQAALKQAESQVAASRARLEALEGAGVIAAQRVAEARVVQAELAVTQAQMMVEQGTLRAPLSGTVSSVTEKGSGERLAAGETVATVADLGVLQVELRDLDDWGAAVVTPNQLAIVVVPALGNRRLRGFLTFLSPEPTVGANGAVFYKALVTLETAEPALRWGMAVRVELDVPGGRGR